MYGPHRSLQFASLVSQEMVPGKTFTSGQPAPPWQQLLGEPSSSCAPEPYYTVTARTRAHTHTHSHVHTHEHTNTQVHTLMHTPDVETVLNKLLWFKWQEQRLMSQIQKSRHAKANTFTHEHTFTT